MQDSQDSTHCTGYPLPFAGLPIPFVTFKTIVLVSARISLSDTLRQCAGGLICLSDEGISSLEDGQFETPVRVIPSGIIRQVCCPSVSYLQWVICVKGNC